MRSATSGSRTASCCATTFSTRQSKPTTRVTGQPSLAQFTVKRDRLGRLITRPTMQLKDHPEVYGAGDAVTVEGNPTASIPIIPAALAHARLAAENILAEL